MQCVAQLSVLSITQVNVQLVAHLSRPLKAQFSVHLLVPLSVPFFEHTVCVQPVALLSAPSMPQLSVLSMAQLSVYGTI